MERKTVHALLLSLAVVTGGVMMTTDAHAQTNTERLITTVDNTNSILDALAALADTVANGFASVLEALGAVQANTEAIQAELGHVEGELQSIDSDLMAIDGDLQSIDSDLMAIDGDLQSIDSDLMDINSNLQNVQSDMAGLTGSIAGSTTAFSAVSDAVQANTVAINDLSAKLDMISEAVGVVQETVVAPPTADPSTMLFSGETEQTVSVADFAASVTKHPTNSVYKATNTFSCDGDVFLDMMMVSENSVNAVLHTVERTAGTDVAPATTVSVNGFNLYETYDNSGTAEADDTNVIKLVETRDFDNQFLSTGSSLVIKGETDQSSDSSDGRPDSTESATQQNYLVYEVTNDTTGAVIGDTGNVYFTLEHYVGLESNKATIQSNYAADGSNVATKTQLGTVELYTIAVSWFSTSSDTTCSISSAVETSSGLANTDNNVLVGLNLVDAEAAPPSPTGTETIDCNGEDTEIISASIQAGSSGLSQFNSLVLTAGSEEARVSFNSDGTLDADSSQLPFRFSGTDLTVDGEALNNLLIQLNYDTTQGNSCKVTTTS